MWDWLTIFLDGSGEDEIAEVNNLEIELHSQQKQSASIPTRRTFKFEKVREDKTKNKVYWKNFVEFQTLSKGEFFAGRAILGDEIAKDNFEFQEFLKKIPKAKLTVVNYLLKILHQIWNGFR